MDNAVLQILGSGDRYVAAGLNDSIATCARAGSTRAVYCDFSNGLRFVLSQLSGKFDQIILVIRDGVVDSKP